MLLTDSFLDYLLYERNYSEGTVRYYRTDILELQKFGEKLLGDLAPSDVGADLVREWIVSLMDKGYAPNTVNRKLSSVRTYYKYLLKKGLVAADPLRRVTGPKKKKPLPVFLREGEVDRLLDDVDFGERFEGYRDRLIIEMFYTTGMRLSELIGLDDKDVDFSASLIKVTGKRNKQRLIPFDKELGRSMQEYVNVRNQALPVRSDAFFVRKELEGMEQLAFVVIQLRFKGEGRIALIQVGQQLGDEGHLRLGFLVSAAGLALPGGKPFVHGGDVRQNELRIDDFNVAQGVHGTKLVDDVVIVKAAHHLHDGVHFTDIRQELVAQSGSFRGALDQAGNVHEFNERGDDFFRAGHVGKHLQAGVRHRDHAHVRINGAEGIIGRLGLAGSGDRVEEGGLADVGETYNTCL